MTSKEKKREQPEPAWGKTLRRYMRWYQGSMARWKGVSLGLAVYGGALKFREAAVSWENPYTIGHYDAPAQFIGGEWTFPYVTEEEGRQFLPFADVKPGAEALPEDVLQTLRAIHARRSLHAFTRGAGIIREEDGGTGLFTHDAEEEVREAIRRLENPPGPEDPELILQDLEYFEPQSVGLIIEQETVRVGRPEDFDLNPEALRKRKVPFPFSKQPGDVGFYGRAEDRGFLFRENPLPFPIPERPDTFGLYGFSVWPLELHLKTGLCFYRVAVALEVRKRNWEPVNLTEWSKAERDALLDALLYSIRKEMEEDAGRPVVITEPPSPLPSPIKEEEAPLYLQDRPSLISQETMGFLAAINMDYLPKHLKDVPRLEELKKKEVQNILSKEGEENALIDFREVTGDPRARPPLLEHARSTWTSEGKEILGPWKLTPHARKSLLDRIGPGGYRDTRETPMGLQEDVLVRRVGNLGGFTEVTLSWFRRADILTQEGREEREREAGDIFTPREEREKTLWQLQALKKALPLARFLASKLGGERVNPIHVSSKELDLTLSTPDHLPDREKKKRREAALEALSRLECTYEQTRGRRKAEGRGSFLSGWHSLRSRQGRNYWITLSQIALGSLSYFFSGTGGTKPLEGYLNFGKKLLPSSKDNTESPSYLKLDVEHLPLFCSVQGFTEDEKQLFMNLYGSRTRKMDGTVPGREHLKQARRFKKSQEPRVYTSDFRLDPSYPPCHLLPKGRRFHGLLKRSPSSEKGWHLKTIYEALGWPERQKKRKRNPSNTRKLDYAKALGKLRRVIEETSGGVVAVWAETSPPKWLTLKEAEREIVDRADRLFRFFPFLPEDWIESQYKPVLQREGIEIKRNKEEAYAASRAAAGEDVIEIEGKLSLLGEDLKSTREEQGLSQTRAARLFGVSRAAWSGWENGKKPSPGMKELLTSWIKEGTAPTEEELDALPKPQTAAATQARKGPGG